jgi:ATP-dependent Clp protease ATP-binding subunit ClpC
LINKGVQISVDEPVIDWLLKKAEEESNSGARPLRRAIQRYIEDELSEYIIRHKDAVAERVEFTLQDGIVTLIAPPELEPIAG